MAVQPGGHPLAGPCQADPRRSRQDCRQGERGNVLLLLSVVEPPFLAVAGAVKKEAAPATVPASALAPAPAPTLAPAPAPTLTC